MGPSLRSVKTAGPGGGALNSRECFPAPAGIRNRRGSACDAAFTSGHFVQKWRVWGATPTSIFAAPVGSKMAGVATPALLAISAYLGNGILNMVYKSNEKWIISSIKS